METISIRNISNAILSDAIKVFKVFSEIKKRNS